MSKESKTEPEKRQEQAPNIHQRLLAVIRDTGAIAKDDQAPAAAGGYAYRSVDAVIETLRPKLVEHGVMILPSVTAHTVTPGSVTQATVEMTLDLVNVDNPEDRVSVSVASQGNGKTDKALAIAYSYALKTALLGIFQLRGQPDAEAQHADPRETREKREKVKERRKEELDTEGKLGPTETQLQFAAEWENDPRIKKLAVPGHDNITGYDVIRKVILNGMRGNRRQVQGVLDWLAEELSVPQIQAAEKPDASPKAGGIKGFQQPQADDITDDDIPF